MASLPPRFSGARFVGAVAALSCLTLGAGARGAPAPSRSPAPAPSAAPRPDPKAELQEKQACVDASEEAQKLRSQGQLQKARERLVTCARETCPSVVRKDCSEWLVEVERLVPSLVIVAKADGHDAADARIEIDDKAVPSGAEGRAYPVDPGRHRVVVTAADGARAEETVVVREGEQQRIVTVALPSKAVSGGSAGGGGRRFPTTAWVAAGVAGAGIASFAIFGILGRSEVSNLRSTCAPACEQSAVDAAETKLIIADVSLGVGIVATGVATWLFLAAPPKAEQRGVSVTVAPLAQGGFARLQGVF